jgi:hypothetical protein
VQTEVFLCHFLFERVFFTNVLKCATLRSELNLTRTMLRDTESYKEKLHSDLVAAEIRADRLQSATVLAMKTRTAAGKPGLKDEEGQEVVEEPEETKPSSPAVSGPVNRWEFDHSDLASFSKCLLSLYRPMDLSKIHRSWRNGRRLLETENRRFSNWRRRMRFFETRLIF